MPLAILLGNLLHRKLCLAESLIHLVTDLKAVEVDAWPDLGGELPGLCAVGLCHRLYRFDDYTLHRASPTGMNGTDGMVLTIV